MLLKNIPYSTYPVWHYLFRAFSLNSTVHSNTNSAPWMETNSLTSLLYFWRHLRDPLEILHQDLKIFLNYVCNLLHFGGTRWRNWLRHCSTSRKVADSIRDGVTGIFAHVTLTTILWPWGRLKWVPRTFFLGTKGGQCVRLTTLPPSYADCLKI